MIRPLARVATYLLSVALVLTAWGCAPRVKADVIAVSAPGHAISGQTCVILPGPGMTGVTPALFSETATRVQAALAGKGYRPVADADTATMAVRVSWATHGPYQTRERMPQATPPLSSPFGWARQMSGAYGYGRAGYGGFGAGYGDGWNIRTVYQHELVLEARLRSPAGHVMPPAETDAAPNLSSAALPPDYTRPPYAPPLPIPSLAPLAGKRTTAGASPHAPEVDASDLSPFGGDVLWRVVVTSDSQRSGIDPILPHLVSAAGRWMGISTSTRVTVDDELNVTPRAD